ncbi:PA14 domain-containing protein [Sulfitobacter sp. JB4-11]|uniref:PA14 domain-containing protein n=1 Tax=Sulfitobacter rhodophyticola TaxID=3238304 RepID=UPI00351596AE
MKTLSFAALLLTFASPALADVLTLAPADPQPDAGSLTSGLAVSYAYPGKIRTLADAAAALEDAKAGPALPGLSYLDTEEGELTMTSTSQNKVAAAITGYIRFEAPGTYALDVWSNDGIVMRIGGQQVALYDEVHACESAGVQEVEVPQAGWYALEATYFQRKGTACLLMDWNVGGEMGPVPDEAFAFTQ